MGQPRESTLSAKGRRKRMGHPPPAVVSLKPTAGLNGGTPSASGQEEMGLGGMGGGGEVGCV